MSTTHTIDTAMARKMVEASAIRGASIVGQPGGWSVMLKIGMQEKPLGTQRTDKPRTWRSLDTCMEYLRTELHIVRIEGIDASNYSGASVIAKARPDAAARLRQAHEAAAYDKWFRGKVQEALDDPRPSVPHSTVKAHFHAKREALRKRIEEGKS